MEYVNKKTGATFSSPCSISGGDWVLVSDVDTAAVVDKPVVEEDTVVEPEKIVTDTPENTTKTAANDEAFDDITVKQIKQELDAFGIKYDPRAKKQELYDLMLKGK